MSGRQEPKVREGEWQVIANGVGASFLGEGEVKMFWSSTS